MMYNPDDEKIEEATEETGVLEESDISEPAPQAEEQADTPPEESVQESE